MLNINYTTTLINLQDVLVKNVKLDNKTLFVDIELPKRSHICPNCNHETSFVHDYRQQKIKDVSAFGLNVILNYKKRRYRCPHCNKRFSEIHNFIAKYYRMTKRLLNTIFVKLEQLYSFTSVAKELNLSVSTVVRMFDKLSYTAPNKLPKVFGIDEFKGNTNREKFQVIITDPATRRVIDILPTRNQNDLTAYLRKYTKKQRKRVKYFVSDMWKQYANVASTYLKDSIQIVDRYHYIRQMVWAFEAVRIRIQKEFGTEYRLLFKHSKRILVKHESMLKDYERERVNAILGVSNEMLLAYHLKEEFYKLMESENRETAVKLMSNWILLAQKSNIDEYVSCSKTLINWRTGILNSFTVPYSNGFTEGCNNKIKVLKRNAYGYRNFERFRKRILHMFNFKNQLSQITTKKQCGNMDNSCD